MMRMEASFACSSFLMVGWPGKALRKASFEQPYLLPVNSRVDLSALFVFFACVCYNAKKYELEIQVEA
jgi:hypothetical protein